MPTNFFPDACTDVPPRLEVCMAGLGPDAFIGPTAHMPNLLATNMFAIVGAVTEPGKDFHLGVARNLRLPQEQVSPDFPAMMQWLVNRWQRSDGTLLPPVVDICTPTSLHCRQICTAAQARVPYIITDKPAVAEIAEIHEVSDALRQTGAQLWVTFNHRYNFIVAWLKAFVAAHPDLVESIDAGFLQDWLMKEVHFRQADWRTAHKLCALLDIHTHAADLASYVAGSPIVAVEGAKAEMSGVFARQANFYDSGAGKLIFGNKMVGSACCSQSLAGHADDIYVCVNLKDGRKFLWRMEWNCDALFVSHGGTSLENRAGFIQHLRGHSDFFARELGNDNLCARLNAQYGKNPPGHIQGWDTLWYFLFLGIAGAIYRHMGHPCESNLPLSMQIEPPTFQDAGIQATAFVHAHVRSAESEGRRVELTEVLAK